MPEEEESISPQEPEEIINSQSKRDELSLREATREEGTFQEEEEETEEENYSEEESEYEEDKEQEDAEEQDSEEEQNAEEEGQEESKKGQAAQAAKKQIVDKAKKQVVKYILPYILPVLAALLVVIFLTALVMVIVERFSSGGVGGSTAFQTASADSIGALLANTGDSSERDAAIGRKCDDVLSRSSELKKKIEDSNDDQTKEKLEDLERSVLAFCTSSPSSGQEVNNFIITLSQIQYGDLYLDLLKLKDLSTKKGEAEILSQTNTIIVLFDSLNILPKDDPKYKSVTEEIRARINSLNPDSTEDQEIKDLINKIKGDSSRYLGSSNAYTPLVDNIKEVLKELTNIINVASSSKIVMSGRDKYYVRNYQVDDRVIRALNYLVTPQEMGGAGFRKIKVLRIKVGYDRESKQYENEWNFSSSGDQDKDEMLVSAHFDGQAVDISGIGMVDRRLYKKGVLKKKIEPQPPVDIMVSSQSATPGKAIPGSSATSTGTSLAGLSFDQALLNLFGIMGENSGYDFSKYNLGGSSMPEIAKFMGLVVLNEEMGLKLDPKEDSSTAQKFYANIGKSYIADSLFLPKSGLSGDSPSEVQSNIGREVIAERMKLAPQSFRGNTSGEIIASVGKRKIEKSFGLRLGSLDYLVPPNDFTTFVGQVLIEEKLGLDGGSLSGNSLAQIKQVIGTDKFKKLFEDNPERTDALVNLSQTNSPTRRFVNQTITPNQYKRLVGDSLIKNFASNFKNHQVVEGVRKMGTGFSSRCGPGTVQAGPDDCLVIGTNLYSKQDEAWDLPFGSIQELARNNYSMFYSIGIDEVAKRLVDDELERTFIRSWLTDFSNESLEDIRFLYSEILDEFFIKTVKDILDLDLELISGLKSRIDQIDREVARLERTSSDESDYSDMIKRFLEEKKILTERLRIAGGLRDEEDEDWFEDIWFSVDEDELNGPLALPLDGISKIFRLNQGEEIFFLVGGSRIKVSENIQNPNEDKESAARLLFLNKQREETISKLEEMRERRDSGKGEPGLDGQIKLHEGNLRVWENEIRMEESRQAERKTALERQKETPRNTNINIDVKDIFNLTTNISAFSSLIGSSKIESVLDLPNGSISQIFDPVEKESPELKFLLNQKESQYQSLQKLIARRSQGEQGLEPQILATERSISSLDKLIEQQRKIDSDKKSTQTISFDPVAIGKRQIEEELGLPLGSFGGENLEELIVRLGGEEKAYGYFARGVSFANIQSRLPITDENSSYFKPIFTSTDERLGASRDATYDLFKGNLTPIKYAEKVGLNTVRTRSVDVFAGDLGLGVGNYTLNGDDMNSMLNGDYLSVLLKVGAKSIDENIELPLGTAKAMIDNPSANCSVQDASTGARVNCIENLLIANGQAQLAQFLGVYGDTTISSNMTENMGQSAIESALNELYPNPILPFGWFEGDSLRNMALGLALKIGTPEEIRQVKERERGFQNIANKYGREILKKFGFISDIYTLGGIEKTEFVTGSEAYKIAIKVDEKLKIQTGTTARFLRKEISVLNYKASAQKSYAGNRAFDMILPNMPESVRNFIENRNLGYSEIKGFYDLAMDPTYRRSIETIIQNRRDYAGEQVKEDHLLGQVIIETKLGSSPIGWFDEIKVSELPKTKGLKGVVENIAFLNNVGSAAQYFATKDASELRKAENLLLSKFGFDPNYQSLEAISKADFSPEYDTPINPYTVTRNIDSKLRIPQGTTQDLFQGKLSVEDYKEKVRKYYVNNEVGEVAFNTLLPNDIQVRLARYGVTGENIGDAIKEPNAIYNQVLMNVVNPADLYTFLGFSEILGINIPIKGNFPDNFAQRVVEERLGLKEGSFSPNSTIEKVMEENGPKKFAASFRISLDYSRSDSDIKSYLVESVFQPDSSPYWSVPQNILRPQNIDSVLKLNTVDSDSEPTRMLLQKELSIAQYLDLVRENQFSQFDKNSFFVEDFVSFLTSGDANNPDSKMQRVNSYLGAGMFALGAFKNPEALKDSNVQLGLLQTIQSVGKVSLDSKMGFTPGTMENLIKSPADSRSILLAQGLQITGQKMFFGDAEPYRNDLLILMQYYLPTDVLDPRYYVSVGQTGNSFDPNFSGRCVADVGGSIDPDMVKERRTACSRQIVDIGLRDVIKNATEIKDKDGNKIGEGISIPLRDLRLLEKGDLGVITNVSIAYSVNQVKAQQDKNGNNISLIPPEFHLSYEDIKNAFNPTPETKRQLQNQAALKYLDDWTKGDEDKRPPITSPAYIEGLQKARDSATSNARKELQYRYMDAQLMSLAQVNDMAPIQAGFTNTMFTGTDRERMDALMAYGLTNLLLTENFDKVFGKTAPYLGELKTEIQNFISKRDIGAFREYINSGAVARDAMFSYVDGFLGEEIKQLGVGMSVPQGTAEYLLVKSYDRLLPGNVGSDELNKLQKFESGVIRGFTVALASNFMDKKLGLKPGTSQGIYSIYSAYRSVEVARKAVALAQVNYDTVKAAVDAGQATADQLTDFAGELDSAKSGFNMSKADLISLGVSVALYAFGEELAKMDQNLGLPAGSIAAIIAYETSVALYLIYGTNPITVWIAAAMMVYTILFGFSKIEYQITCPGDYTFRSWCKESDNLYTQWAQISVRKLIDDMLNADERTGQKDLQPIIMGTFREEDLDHFYGVTTGDDLITKHYGPAGINRGIKGLHQSDFMADYVHIGY